MCDRGPTARTLIVAVAICAAVNCSPRDAGPGVDLVRRELVNGHVSILIPSDLAVTGDAVTMASEIAGEGDGIAVSNAASTVRIQVIFMKTEAPDGSDRREFFGEQEIHAHLKAPMKQTVQLVMNGVKSAYPTAAWLQDEVVTINGHEFFVLDCRLPGGNAQARTTVAATPLEGGMLVVGFSCATEMESLWAPVGRRVIDSVVLKE